MKNIELPVESRSESGKTPARRLRAAGRVPAVFYGKKTKPVKISVNAHEFRKLVDRAGTNPLFDLQIEDDGKITNQTALLKERQVRPIDGALVHLDFIQVFMDEAIEISVPLVFEGKPKGVEMGGLLQPNVREVLVSCLPADVPQSIAVDIAHLDVGQSVHIGELLLPSGVTALQDAGIAVATVVIPKRVVEEAVEEEALEELAEGEEAAEEGADAEGKADKTDSTKE